MPSTAPSWPNWEARGLCYPCFCSRAQLHAASAPHASDGELLYSGACRDLTPAQVAEKSRTRSPALRLRVPEETIAFTDLHDGPQQQYLPTGCGDFILRRSDGVYAYQLAVVADDGAMGVNQVVRGRDLLSSTPRQILLYRLLGYPVPEFGHTPLLLASDGRRLSKRDGDQSLSGHSLQGLLPPGRGGGLGLPGGPAAGARPRLAGGAAAPFLLGEAAPGGHPPACGAVWAVICPGDGKGLPRLWRQSLLCCGPAYHGWEAISHSCWAVAARYWAPCSSSSCLSRKPHSTPQGAIPALRPVSMSTPLSPQ